MAGPRSHLQWKTGGGHDASNDALSQGDITEMNVTVQDYFRNQLMSQGKPE